MLVDEAEVARYKETRAVRLATIEIPRLRIVGFALVWVAAYLHNRYLLGQQTSDGWALVTWMFGIYCGVSWIALLLLYRRIRAFDLSVFFLAFDVVIGAVALYFCGAEQSWLFFFLLAHVADQTNTTFQRSFGFALLGGLCYAVMIAYIVVVDHRPEALTLGFPKLAIALIGGIYIAFAARPAEARRRRTSTAFQTARRLIEELEKQSEELRKARERADEANLAKSEFLARMTHELRTPLHGILGMIQLAAESDVSPERRRQLDLARRSADGLLGTIDDILDFSKIEARRLELAPVPLSVRDLVADTTRTLALVADEKGLDVYFRVAPDVRDSLTGDAMRLRQVLMNLIGNAIKFTPRGEIVVSVSLAGGDQPQDGQLLQFEVRDTGIGIPAEKRDVVFQAFTQADSSMSRRYGGTGLGLAIVRRLVDLMGGTISVESDPGRGSSFRFTARLTAGDPGAAEPGRHDLLAHRRILVLDRKERSREVLDAILRQNGMEPVLCSTAGMAAAALERHEAIDCALVCAATAGELVVKQIGRQVPMVGMLSPRAALGRQADFAVRVSKPVAERELLDAIAGAVGLKPSAEALERETDAVAVAPVTIVLAEDHPVNQEFAADAIHRLGHNVLIASDGEAALEIMKNERFDLALMDIQMPLLDGIEVARRFREWERKEGRRPVPIVALTAHASTDERDLCLQAGMNGFVAKPIDRQQLAQVIARFATSAAPPPAVHGPQNDILAAAGGNLALLGRVGKAFEQQTPPAMLALRRAIDDRDAEVVREQAHKIKGAVSNFPGSPAVEAARNLEEAGKAGNLTGAEVLFARLEADVQALIADIRRVVARASG